MHVTEKLQVLPSPLDISHQFLQPSNADSYKQLRSELSGLWPWTGVLHLDPCSVASIFLGWAATRFSSSPARRRPPRILPLVISDSLCGLSCLWSHGWPLVDFPALGPGSRSNKSPCTIIHTLSINSVPLENPNIEGKKEALISQLRPHVHPQKLRVEQFHLIISFPYILTWRALMVAEITM